MFETALAICFGYIIGQAICVKCLAHDKPNILSLPITVAVFVIIQIARNTFSGANGFLTEEIFFLILTGCAVGHIIVTELFKR